MSLGAPTNVQAPRAPATSGPERSGGLFGSFGGPQQPTPNTPENVRNAVVGQPEGPQNPKDARQATEALTSLVGVPPGHRAFDSKLAKTLQDAGFSPQEIAALRTQGQGGRPGDISLEAARNALETRLAGPLTNENRQLPLASLIKQQQAVHRAQVEARQPTAPSTERPEPPRMMAGLDAPRSGFRPLQGR